MHRSHPPAPGGDPRGSAARARHGRETIVLEAVTFRSAHGLLKACRSNAGWKNAGDPCAAPEWTAAHHRPVSHTLGEEILLELTVKIPEGAEGALHGKGPGGLRLSSGGASTVRKGVVTVHSSRPFSRKIEKLTFTVRWSGGGGEALSPGRTENVVYATPGRPRDDRQGVWPEDGVTLRRMDRAVAWVAPLRTRRPHAIVRALIEKFPFYALHPSPKVPRRYHHPTYFNEEGGAWPMADYVGESGECQAIVRLVRAVLRQLGVPGEARAVLVWGDPDVDGGQTALSAYMDDDPGAGLRTIREVDGRQWIAALVDAPVKVGKVYPPSHTPRRGGVSPGLNRFEACLEFTHDHETRDYGGGAGVFRNREEVLRGFWGLVWVSAAPRHGFRVEEIVTEYR